MICHLPSAACHLLSDLPLCLTPRAERCSNLTLGHALCIGKSKCQYFTSVPNFTPAPCSMLCALRYALCGYNEQNELRKRESSKVKNVPNFPPSSQHFSAVSLMSFFPFSFQLIPPSASNEVLLTPNAAQRYPLHSVISSLRFARSYGFTNNQ